MIDLIEMGFSYEVEDMITLMFGPIGEPLRDEFEISVKENSGHKKD